jgi:RNA polymerase sigma-B factor
MALPWSCESQGPAGSHLLAGEHAPAVSAFIPNAFVPNGFGPTTAAPSYVEGSCSPAGERRTEHRHRAEAGRVGTRFAPYREGHMSATINAPDRSRRPGLELAGAQVDELARRWHDDGDQNARDELAQLFMPLASRLAKRYRNPYEPIEDLTQVACVGLLGAIDRFDPSRGIEFRSFAIPTILGELKRHFRNTGWTAHVPRGAQDLALRVDRAARDITDRTGRPPSPDAIAAFLEIDLDDVLVGIDAATAHFSLSLDAPTGGSDSSEPRVLGDDLGNADDRFDLVDAKLSMAVAISRLPHRERTALQLRLEQDLKQSEIGARMGCSQMQVSRLLRQAASRVRELTDPPLDVPPR